MLEGKKGLRLLSLSIVLQIVWSVVAVIINMKVAKAIVGTGDISESLYNFWNYIPLITACVAVLCYLLDFSGLRIAGHESDRFNKAWKLKVLSLLFAIFAVIFGVIAVTQESNPGLIDTANTISMIANIFIAVANVLAIILVAKGCADLAPRAEGLSKFVLGLFFIDTVLMVICQILDYIAIKNGDEALYNTVSYIGLGFVIVGAAFAIFYILLIFKATRTAGKAKR